MRVSLLMLTATVLSRGGLYLKSPSKPVGAGMLSLPVLALL